jgi:fructose-1,6-bisphosphatase II
MRSTDSPTRELIEAAIVASRAAFRHVGSENKFAVDRAAVDAMRASLNAQKQGFRVVIGEGAKDEAPMLFNGEILGVSGSIDWDIAVDPIDGTRLAAYRLDGAVSVIGASEPGEMMNCPDVFYMKKLVCGPEGVGLLDIDYSATQNIQNLADALQKPISELSVAVIDKPVNAELIEEVKASGAHWYRFEEGDIAMAVAAATPGSGVDLLLGVGGNPEGVLAACAVRILGGFMQGVLAPRSIEEIEAALNSGFQLDKKFGLSELVGGTRQIFVMAGVTDGILVEGIKVFSEIELDVQLFVLDTDIEGGRLFTIRINR